jgi:hypothetical protein
MSPKACEVAFALDMAGIHCLSILADAEGKSQLYHLELVKPVDIHVSAVEWDTCKGIWVAEGGPGCAD